LRRIDRLVPPASCEEPFVVRCRDGSVISGEVLSFADNSVNFRSARHGEMVLKGEEVLSIRRARGPKLLFAGPVGDRGWRLTANEEVKATNRPQNSAAATATVSVVDEGPGGSLTFPYWNGNAALEVEIPEKFDTEFRVSSTVRPDFSFSIEADPKRRLRIETWDDELVIAAANRFKRIRRIGEKDRVIALRLCWDRATHQCAIYAPEGELITEWQVPDETDAPPSEGEAQKKTAPGPFAAVVRRRAAPKKGTPTKPGLTLQNKGRDLALEQFKVRAWDGQQPSKTDLSQPRIELGDGRTIPGAIVSLINGSLNFRSADGSEQVFPVADVDAVVFSPKAPEAKQNELKLSFADGTLLFGRPTAIADGRILLETAFSKQPIATALEGLRKMLISAAPAGATPDPAITNLDKLVIEQTTLHGTLRGSGDAMPKWQLVGSGSPVTPVKGRLAEITCAIPPGKITQPAPGLIYLDSGDILPGRVRSIDRSGVEFESDTIEVKHFPSSRLNAVQFGAATRAKFDGFLDQGWQVVKGTDETVQRTAESLHMEPETAIAHPSALFANEVTFTMKSKSFSCVRLRLFSAGTEAGNSTNLVIMNMGNRITAGMEQGDGQFDNENQVGLASGKPARVKLVVSEKHVTLSVNGYQMQKYAIDPAKRAGAGLVIEPCSMWGNSVNAIDLSDFSANSDVGKTWLPDVPTETKIRALTVPRFRKDDAPRHALLAANGDVLRGEIEAITANHVGFRSGLENIRVPRDRVKAAIWLKKSDSDVSAAPSGNRVAERLAQRIEGRMMYGGAQLSTLIGVLRRQDAELQFKLPKEDNRSFEMSFGGQSIGDALEQICSLFGMSYRIDPDGTIVVESGTQPQSELVQRAYWMKSDAFKSATVREVLAAKGISFPSGAAASWNSTALQLTIVNTPPNHQKLAKLLEEEFGGMSGSPTHWLSLTNGARFSLVIDKFDPEAVTGHHPVYGACRVPLEDIYTIRTSMPPATEAMKSVSDWRLVFAPEPVLPESPGESSPLLGKAAKPFKLPLLAGGDFELAKEQGKVVILDFWATWCGPCIKSLPGLIDAVSKLPADRVKLIGLNQGEPPEQVKQFIETRRWALTVALDSSQTVGRDYGVDGIPFTVIVGPDGKVAWVHTGYVPDGEVEVTKVVQQLLSDTPR
jgi:thiol-disulfide isomerase/thioredoxin